MDGASDKSGILEVEVYYMSFMPSTDELLDFNTQSVYYQLLKTIAPSADKFLLTKHEERARNRNRDHTGAER